ncbi:MAG: NAD(P)/FAD-dependent oxidoreductase [Acidobacteriota bacterium]
MRDGTATADVVVIGAGPAGSAAAAALAAAGVRVVLADQARFPRPKVCGDGLLPDARRALASLGVGEAIRSVARPVPTTTMRTASGLEIRFPVESWVLPRHVLDARLVEHARMAGAEFREERTLEGFEVAGDGVRKVLLRTPAGTEGIVADAFLLATGAARKPRELAGFIATGAPAAALRGYTRVDDLAGDELLIALLPDLGTGYAWAFPGPDGLWNVGCGVFAGVRRAPPLSRVLERFRSAIGGRSWEVPPRGAPLVTSFPSQPIIRGNLAAIGEAAGLTRPFSGEGIGPSLQSGLLAAHCLSRFPGHVGIAAYRREIVRRYRSDFRAWRFGEIFLRAPRVVDLIVRRARRYPGAQRRCADVLGGTSTAGTVLSPLGLVRLIVGR